MPLSLCPAQQRAFDTLLSAQPIGHLFALYGRNGLGKTAVLRALHARLGGAFLTMKEFVDAMRPQHPLALEETFEHWLRAEVDAHERVFLDDLDLLSNVTNGCGSYPRSGFLDAPVQSLVAHAVATGKRLIVSCRHGAPWPIQERCISATIDEFAPEDYEAFCRAYLRPEVASGLDYAKVHRFAGHLTGHQLAWVCAWLNRREQLSTQELIDFLLTHHLTSNVDLEEVQKVQLSDLKGIDEVIRSLEANVILPLENDELARELHLRPNRGVLLLGPPGTGKTTVGRALAHRLKSKFFLIDGTFISGSGGFYGAVHQVFYQAQQNAPSILFIDDTDVMFESGEELGLYRYLLTMLDGLESESAGRVCVMMAAMGVGGLPPALIRSGRIELWLEMRLPDEAARREILANCLAPLPEELRQGAEMEEVAAATEGFTGADLKRLVEDGKNALAYDRVQGKVARPLSDYLLSAAEALRANKRRYAEAEAAGQPQRPARVVAEG